MATDFETEQEAFFGGSDQDGLISAEPEPLIVEEEVKPQPEVVPVEPAIERVPVYELQRLQQELRQAHEENHAQRIAMLSASQQVSPAPFDPIETAKGKIKKKMDVDAYKFWEPGLDPILNEQYQIRMELQELRRENEALRNGQNQLAAENHEAKVHTYLASQIPNLAELTPRLLEFVGKMSPQKQDYYAKNPEALADLANAMGSSGVAQTSKQAPRNTSAESAKMSLDAGAGTTAPAPRSLQALESARPGSNEFESFRKNFWGESNI